MRTAVIGAGGWGTAFSRLLSTRGHRVVLWARRPEMAALLSRERENQEYLPGVRLPEGIAVTASLAEALAAAEVIFFAVPSFALAEVAGAFPFVPPEIPVVNLAKGLEPTGRRLSEVLAEALPGHPLFALSGPCHAEEVGRDHPTAVVLAGEDVRLGRELQRAIAAPRFLVQLSLDLLGVEYCGAVKNVVAIGVGIADGLGFGDNTRAALITQGLAEMVEFCSAVGARVETIYGLAGLGDLVATATSWHSRNRYVGSRLGRGEPLSKIIKSTPMVAEGVYGAKALWELSQNLKAKVKMPITEAVYRILYLGEPLGEETPALMLGQQP